MIDWKGAMHICNRLPFSSYPFRDGFDTAWKQLLRSLPEAEGDEETPPDLAAKINRIVQELEDLESV